MKKIFALILAVMMIATMSVTAFAAEENPATNEGGDTTITVNGTYDAGDTATVISVVVSWDAMSFTYTDGSEGTWDPGTHSYNNAATGSWSTETATITVTNHSNAAITATCTFEATATGVVGKFDGETTKTLNVASADDDAYRTAVEGVYPAPSASTEFGISGEAISADGTLGTITVTIAKAN